MFKITASFAKIHNMKYARTLKNIQNYQFSQSLSTTGEDRWLCTLMVERGWRLDYCASATDTTYCPEEFNEFFKQRRRWGPSTLANQALLIQRQGSIRQSNDDINLVFIVYQVLMLVSTIIG